MPNLSPEGVREFWHERHDHALYRIIASLESVEHWTLDNEVEFEAAINLLGEALELLEKFDLSQEDKLIQVLSSLKSGRALRVLQFIDKLQPGSASKLLIYAEVSSTDALDLPGYFLKRNLIFERLQLLGRIFAPERFNLVERAFEQAEK